MTKKCCDRCGAESKSTDFDDTKGWFHFTIEQVRGQQDHIVDLCADCTQKLMKWLKEPHIGE